jgi:hypothetical protein
MRIGVLISCLAFAMSACGTKHVITGRVQIYGNEPHTFAGIIDEKGVAYAAYPQEKAKELEKFQGRLIEFEVEFVDDPQIYNRLEGGVITPLKWRIIK